jgi:hypothetical protein
MSLASPDLVFRAWRLLGLNQQLAAKVYGSSLRTVQRYSSDGGLTMPEHLHRLVRAVHPRDPDLAGELAKSGGTTLEALGLQTKVVAPGSSPSRPKATREHAEVVLWAAANAADVSSAVVRPMIEAAFARALELDVDWPALAALLAPGAKKRPPAKG